MASPCVCSKENLEDFLVEQTYQLPSSEIRVATKIKRNLGEIKK